MRFPKWPRWVWRLYAATFAAVAAFVVCLLLPIWGVSQFMSDGYCGRGFGDSGSIGWMFGQRWPGDYFDDEYHRTVTWDWETPAVITAVSVHVAAIAGFILGGVRWWKPNVRKATESS